MVRVVSASHIPAFRCNLVIESLQSNLTITRIFTAIGARKETILIFANINELKIIRI